MGLQNMFNNPDGFLGRSQIAPPPDSLRFLPLALLLSLLSRRVAPVPFPLFPLHPCPFQPTNELQHVVKLLKTYLCGTVDTVNVDKSSEQGTVKARGQHAILIDFVSTSLPTPPAPFNQVEECAENATLHNKPGRCKIVHVDSALKPHSTHLRSMTGFRGGHRLHCDCK